MTGLYTPFASSSSAASHRRMLGADHFPSPFLDYASMAMPTDHTSVLEMCQYIYSSNGAIRMALDRIIAYFLTPLEFGSADPDKALGDDEKDKWDDFAEQNNLLLEIQALDRDFLCYGNSFASVIVPHRRLMGCRGRCRGWWPLREVFENPQFRFSFRDMTFSGRCPRCGWSGAWEVIDQPETAPEKLIIKRWAPQEIVIRSDQWTGECEYLWDIPADYKQQVKSGQSLFHLERVSKEILEAIKHNLLFRFEPGQLFHMREEALAGHLNRGWGISRLLSNFRQVWYVQLLHRYNEALALDYVIPLRVVTPRDSQSENGPLGRTNMGSFTSEVRRMLRERRKDPAKWFTLPFPVEYQMLGGDASQLAPRDLLEQGWDMLLNSLGVPMELYKGTLQMQTAPVALRWFEATFYSLVTNNNAFLAWFVERVSELLSWEKVKATHRRVTHADDMQRHMAVLQMATGGHVSLTSGLRLLGLDWKDEQRRIMEEQRYMQEQQSEVQEEMEQAAYGQQIAKGMPPGGDPMAQGAMPPGGDPMAAGGGQAAAGGAMMMPGAMPAGSVVAQVTGGNAPQTMQDMMSAADAAANALLGLPELQRHSELSSLRQQNPALHALVRQKMDQIRSDARSQGQQMIMGQVYGQV